jgi:hypothetical protein
MTDAERSMKKSQSVDRQAEEWSKLYERVTALLGKFGTYDALGDADFWVLDDNWGTRQQKVFVNNLSMLSPTIIAGLRALLSGTPDWEIVVAVSIRGAGEKWPDMGLTVREREIVDGLQRSYFPAEFQSLYYVGSRPGTEQD